MKSIVFFNNKGGVGKTTLACNIASYLSLKNYRVLVVDADPQCNATQSILSEERCEEIYLSNDDYDTLYSVLEPLNEGESSSKNDIKPILKTQNSYNVDINTIEKMVFTKAEYHKAKKENPSFYSMLRALFITHTCLFIGCSMDDPDINLLLEDVKIDSNATHPHYVLVKTGDNSEIKKADWIETYNIQAIEYGKNYNELPIALENLYEEVSAFRVNSPEA